VKILVTGAAGFIGSHLAERLRTLGHDVVGIDCLTDFYPAFLKENNLKALTGIPVHRVDLAYSDISRLIHTIDVIFHCAAQPSISPHIPITEYWKDNLLATHNVVAYARRLARLKGFIYISSSSVYGAYAAGPETTEARPVSLYGITKLASEQLVLAETRKNGFPGCAVRLFSVYGPRERPDKLYFQLIRCAIESKPINLFHSSLTHERSYTYIDDAIHGLLLILGNIGRSVGEIFNIGSDRAVSTAEGIRTIEVLTGCDIVKNDVPDRAGDQVRTRAHIDKARSVLGFEPSVDLYSGLEKQVAWFRKDVMPVVHLL
jgi:UDP-glucuronate 4-epimerase